MMVKWWLIILWWFNDGQSWFTMVRHGSEWWWMMVDVAYEWFIDVPVHHGTPLLEVSLVPHNVRNAQCGAERTAPRSFVCAVIVGFGGSTGNLRNGWTKSMRSTSPTCCFLWLPLASTCRATTFLAHWLLVPGWAPGHRVQTGSY